MNNELHDVKWEKFLIEDLFDVHIGKNVDGNKVDKKEGKNAYITRKETDNGLDGFIDFRSEYINKKSPVITIGNETAEPFVQTFPFYTRTKVNILIPKIELSRNELIFIAQSIKQHKSKYSYSYTINSSRLRKQIILLPVDINDKPNWTFMNQYIENIERKLLCQYVHYLSVYNIQNNYINQSRIQWKQFKILDLFTLKPGKSNGLNHLKKSNDGINYLGATNLNNGVLCQVERDKTLVQKGNCIAFIRNGEGSMGYSVYKSEDFIATSDMTLGYNNRLNRYIGTFITTVADQIRGKYNFGYKRNGKRLENEIILLPADKNGNPDYKYMENYMKMIEAKQLQIYLNYLISRKKISIN